eukprot:240401-Rhodomonas_salina.2
MSLGAGVMERHPSIRKVSHRLAFLQAVWTDVRVSHPNPGQVGLWGTCQPPPGTIPSLDSQRVRGPRPMPDERIHRDGRSP